MLPVMYCHNCNQETSIHDLTELEADDIGRYVTHEYVSSCCHDSIYVNTLTREDLDQSDLGFFYYKQ